MPQEFIGLGCDVEEVARLREVLQRRPAFLKRWFTPDEQERLALKDCPEEEACAIFCLKEATIKALWHYKHLTPAQIEITKDYQVHLTSGMKGLHFVSTITSTHTHGEAWVHAWLIEDVLENEDL